MNAGAGASGNSIASIGLSTFATMLKADGTANFDNYQADRLEQAAVYGQLKAVQVGGQMTRNLNTTLGNIDAVRSAANADPNSPTGAAFRDNQEAIGTENKTIAVGSIEAQALQDRNDAAYYRSASSNALLSGGISAGAGILSGIGGIRGSGAPGGSSIGDPTQIGSLY